MQEIILMKNAYDTDYYYKRYVMPLYVRYGLAKLYYLWIAFFCLILPAKLNRKCRVLEIGCGVGNLVWALRFFGVQAYGVDPSIAARNFSKAISYCVYGKRLRETKNYYDLVYTNEVLEHISTPKLKALFKNINYINKGPIIHMVGVKEKGSGVENDETHIVIENENWWASFFESQGYKTRVGNIFYFFPSLLFKAPNILSITKGYFFLTKT